VSKTVCALDDRCSESGLCQSLAEGEETRSAELLTTALSPFGVLAARVDKPKDPARHSECSQQPELEDRHQKTGSKKKKAPPCGIGGRPAVILS
jgi:hypothetical protein